MAAGDLFVDVTGDVKYGHTLDDTYGYLSGEQLNSKFGYDYVFDMSFKATASGPANTYDLYSLTGNSRLQCQDQNNYESNPWRWNSGGTLLANNANMGGTLGGANPLVDGNPLLQGLVGEGTYTPSYKHYVAQVDLAPILSGLAPNTVVTLHYTMECGNDNLMGQFTTPQQQPPPMPDGGTTAILLSFALAGVGAAARKFT